MSRRPENPPHDQTRGDSTPFLSEGQTASLSHNEVMSLCMKAARGAGMSWGMAEEAGQAAGWLIQHGFDGPALLCAHLQEAQGRAWGELCPKVAIGEWTTPVNRALCPIILGATLSDFAALPEGIVVDVPLRIGRVDYPVLLVPFLARISDKTNLSLDLEWNGGSLRIGGDPSPLAEGIAALNGSKTSLMLTGRLGAPQPAAFAPAPDICAHTIAALNAFALRTTVPPSEASRAGAGSSSSDND